METEKLTKQERKYIIDDLVDGLNCCRYGVHKSLTPKQLEKLNDEGFDIKEKEFELIKSIIKKLK